MSLGETNPAESRKLNLLRAVAVTFVVLSHLPITLGTSHVYHMQALGLFGVAIFFVHTCLVLMHSLERQTDKYGENRLALRFFIRRMFRIYPLSSTTVLALAAIQYNSAGTLDFAALLANLLLVQNLSGLPSTPPALWSLPFEVQMYLLLPLLFVLCRAAGTIAWVVVLLAWIASAGTTILLWYVGFDYGLVKYFPCFLPGVLAFTLQKKRPRLDSAVLFSFVLFAALGVPIAVGRGIPEHLLAWLVCLALGVLIPFTREMRTGRVAQIGHIIAKYSFGIYLLHEPCIHLAFGVCSELPSALQWTIFICTTIGLTYSAHKLVEQPSIEFGRMLSEEMNRNAIPFGLIARQPPYTHEEQETVRGPHS
jgi:peptidoglycan/LPS O-acetylase OafA/YrhL